MLIRTQYGGIINMDLIQWIGADKDGNVIVDQLGQDSEWEIGSYPTSERAQEVVREIFDCRLSRYVMPEA